VKSLTVKDYGVYDRHALNSLQFTCVT